MDWESLNHFQRSTYFSLRFFFPFFFFSSVSPFGFCQFSFWSSKICSTEIIVRPKSKQQLPLRFMYTFMLYICTTYVFILSVVYVNKGWKFHEDFLSFFRCLNRFMVQQLFLNVFSSVVLRFCLMTFIKFIYI